MCFFPSIEVNLASFTDGHNDRASRTLVSSGAHAFAQRHGIETVDPTSMVASRAKEDWQRWMKRHDEPGVASTGELEAGPVALPQDAMQDTVGAIAWDSEGNLAAGVSRSADRSIFEVRMTTDKFDVYDSGGLLLKYSGRIGEVTYFFPRSGRPRNTVLTDRSEAAAFGAGCWAEQSRDGRAGMACSISGTHES